MNRSCLGHHGVGILLLIALTGGIVVNQAKAETNDSPKIVFLQLQFKKDKTVKLLKSTTTHGRLKSPADGDVRGDIHFELLSVDGQTLWHGATDDPSVRNLEFEDPPRSGKLSRKQVHLGEVEFTVRVPGLPEAKRVEFYTLEQAGTKAVQRRTLGSFSLPSVKDER